MKRCTKISVFPVFVKRNVRHLWSLLVAALFMGWAGWTSYSYPPYGDYSLLPGYGASLNPGDGILVKNDNEEGNLQFTIYDGEGNALDTIILAPGQVGALFVPKTYGGSEIVLMVAWEYFPGHFANFDGGYYTVTQPPK